MIVLISIIFAAIVDAIIFVKKGRLAVTGAVYGVFSYILSMIIVSTIIKGIYLIILSVAISILSTLVVKNK